MAQKEISWEAMIEELHQIFSDDVINIDEVKQVMCAYKSDPKDWQKYAIFDPCRYTRNLVDAGNGKFNLMLLCWGEGHASSIHDHSNSHCFMKQLQGSLTESLYEWPDQGVTSVVSSEEKNESPMKLLKEGSLKVDDVIYICDEIGLHRVSNLSHVQGAVSLHLYCPPFQECNIFDARTGRKTQITSTFWSKYGKRCYQLRKSDKCIGVLEQGAD